MQALPIEAKALNEKPELYQENIEALEAFFKLNARRQAGLTGISRITFNEILSYCELFEVEEKQDFTDKICAADEAFIAHVEQKEQANGAEHPANKNRDHRAG